MNLHTLQPAPGSNKAGRRIGRGEGSGSGDTAGKGHKGAKSRTGFNSKRAHEGGQMPLQMRLPKRGFKNFNRVEYVAVNLYKLQQFTEKHGITEFTQESFIQLGVASKTQLVKVLAQGELKTKVTVFAHSYSAAAKTAIEAAGGVANTLD
jgi:large subunit ribosomal protein L15